MVDGGADLYSTVAARRLGEAVGLVQGKRLKLGMTSLDGTNARAHQSAAGAS